MVDESEPWDPECKAGWHHESLYEQHGARKDHISIADDGSTNRVRVDAFKLELQPSRIREVSGDDFSKVLAELRYFVPQRSRHQPGLL